MISQRISQACCAAGALLLALTTNAAAEFVDWYGAGVLTSVSTANCPTGNFNQSFNRYFTARYLPRNLGTNGPSASLSFLHERYATNFTRLNGAFSLTTLETVQGTTVARFGSAYSPKLRLTNHNPATVTTATPSIELAGIIVGYPGFPGNTTCTVNFRAVVFRP